MMPSEVDTSESSPKVLGLIGTVLSDRYRIEGLLGEGGMGAVYLAEHLLMHKRLAIKVLHPEMMGMPEVVRRFEREALAAAHIEHPNVAAATDFGKLDDGSFFLVLEYVEGTSLYDVITPGPLPVERAVHIAHQMASALARAHALGIVHRDLKPENVMLVDRDGDPDFVKVLDFGIAKVPMATQSHRSGKMATGPTITQVGAVFGTPEYMAPEQALGHEVDARADLYALGVMLFEMLTGVRPFEAEGKATLLGMKVIRDAPSIASKNSAVRVPEPIEGIVQRLLDRDVDNRFQDADAVLDAIEASGSWTARTRAGSMRPPGATSMSIPPPAMRAPLLPRLPRAWAPPRLTPWQIRLRAVRLRFATWTGWMTTRLKFIWAAFPASVRQRVPAELVAGVAAGLLLVFVAGIVLRLRAPANVEGMPMPAGTGDVSMAPGSIPSVAFAAAPSAAPDPSPVIADEPTGAGPGPMPSAVASPTPSASAPRKQASPPKSNARPKRLPGGITDFGGRL